MQDPTVGRIVHYVPRGYGGEVYAPLHRAAVITEINYRDSVGVCVLNPTGIFFDDAVYDPTGTPGTWHWPEREEV